MKLFLDISSSCTGYVLAADSKSEVTIKEVGVIWFDKKATIAEKCYDLQEFIKSFGEYDIEKIIYERYSFNMKNPNGALACPHIQGAVLAQSFADEISIEDITPQTWRKNCGLKKKKEDNWKVITEAHFRAKYDIPEKIESNITGNMRTTPSDYFDALGICEGWYAGQGKEKVKYEQ